MDQNARYREILIAPIRECASYTPKFGHGRQGGFSLSEFQALYGADAFYSWLGLDHPLMYSAHKAAGGITSIYRQIGIGCERLVRAIYMDHLGLTEAEVNWAYTVKGVRGQTRTLHLDGRIPLDSVKNEADKARIAAWKRVIAARLDLSDDLERVMTGIVFEVRQGYKSKDSKRQNADIANASNAYANGYIPCLMVMSSQIDDDIVMRYEQAKWVILRGHMANYVLKYFDDIALHFQNVYRRIAHGGTVHYIVGNSNFYGNTVPSERIYVDMLHQVGFVNATHSIV